MVGKTLDLKSIVRPDSLAVEIGNSYQQFNSFRSEWLKDKRELRNYIFATDTRSTSNSRLPWKNSTTIPKLCQIRDNLHANYMAALFPQSNWMSWEGNDESAETFDIRQVIQAYMENKVQQSGFKQTVAELLCDFIDYGNVFATTEWVEEKSVSETGEEIIGYVGPKIVRVSPLDIVFNPTATDFASSPKVIRTINSIGEIVQQVESMPDDENKKLAQYALSRAKEMRKQFSNIEQADLARTEAYSIDGFSDIKQYYSSGLVETLQFFGTLYDINNDELYEDYIITIIDRAYVLSKKANPSWRKFGAIKHAGWRLRPDNLYAQGALDNLVGMQYRIDHLENLKADAFDMIAFPVLKIKGYVEEFEYAPNERIYVGDDGDVEFMHPDAAALSANTDIDRLEMKMEEMAGAPREAMGIRTAGEKTAYEVQSLQNASSRIFQSKVSYFEEMIIEKLLNDMLELSRRNLPVSDLVRVLNERDNVVEFIKVTKEDLVSSGKIRAVGATHFAKRNMIIQNLTNFANSALGQDPTIMAHISGKKLAHVIEDLFELDKYDVVQDNVRIQEQMETAQYQQAASQELQVQNGTAGLGEQDVLPQQ